MADVSDRRREPKGIPTGGRFAQEDGGRSDASDLEQGYFAEQRHTRGYEYPTDEKEEHPEAGLLADRPEKAANRVAADGWAEWACRPVYLRHALKTRR